MYLFVALSLLSSSLLQTVAESPYQLNHSLNPLAGDNNDSCSEVHLVSSVRKKKWS